MFVLNCCISDDGCTQEMKGDERDAQICCMSDDVILRLATIGVEVLLVILEEQFNTVVFGRICYCFIHINMSCT